MRVVADAGKGIARQFATFYDLMSAVLTFLANDR
jgi:hypothetical protein